MPNPPRGKHFSLWNEPPWFDIPSQSHHTHVFDPVIEFGATPDDHHDLDDSRDMVVHRYAPPHHQGGLDQVINQDHWFVVRLDVQHFAPEEIEVKTVDNRIVVHAKEEEKQDAHGFVNREFTRYYDLPQGVDPMTVTSSINSSGVLTMKAPKRNVRVLGERTVTVNHERM